MGPGGSSSVAHSGNLLSARDPLSLLHEEFRIVGVAGFNAELVLDLDQTAIAREPASVCHDAIGGGIDGCSVRRGEVGALVHPAPAHAEARGIAEVAPEGQGE